LHPGQVQLMSAENCDLKIMEKRNEGGDCAQAGVGKVKIAATGTHGGTNRSAQGGGRSAAWNGD